MDPAPREELGFGGPIPQAGERVICLANNYDAGVFNGQPVGPLDRAGGGS